MMLQLIMGSVIHAGEALSEAIDECTLPRRAEITP
jgi:hypothetical protein